MRYALIILFICLTTVWTSAQSSFEKIKPIAEKARGNSIEELHDELTKGLTSDEDKVRSFYYWITHNINYHVNAWRNKSIDWNKQSTEAVLKSKKAVCHGYSNMFMELCNLSGIRCYLVSGYTKENKQFINEGHSWNTVFINGEWKLVDATWGAGSVENRSKFIRHFDEKYFFSDPIVFLENHYPFDPAWQLVPYPVNLKEYKKQQWSYTTRSGESVYHFNDTISQWETLDSTGRRLAAARRMVGMNPDDQESKIELSFAMTDAAYDESEKAGQILDQLYPKTGNSQNTGRKANIPQKEFSMKLEEAMRHLENAENITKQIQPIASGHREQLTAFKKQLQHNMKVVSSEQKSR